MNKFLILLSLLAFSSCSSVEFSSYSVQKHYVAPVSGSDVVISKSITKDFYFWGLVPKQDLILLEDEFENHGLSNPSYIVVEQGHSARDVFFMLITLGLYSPSTYKITLLSNGNTK